MHVVKKTRPARAKTTRTQSAPSRVMHSAQPTSHVLWSVGMPQIRKSTGDLSHDSSLHPPGNVRYREPCSATFGVLQLLRDHRLDRPSVRSCVGFVHLAQVQNHHDPALLELAEAAVTALRGVSGDGTPGVEGGGGGARCAKDCTIPVPSSQCGVAAEG